MSPAAPREDATILLTPQQLHKKLQGDSESPLGAETVLLPPKQPVDLLQTLDAAPHQAPILEQTIDAAPATHSTPAPLSSKEILRSQVRTTILPRMQPLPDGTAKPVILNQERFETLKPLGEGGVGEVFLVQDNDIQRNVAMKRIKTGTEDMGALMRFAEEIQTIGQLDHPNIVPIHDVGMDADGQHYFIMKHVEGDTLEDIIDRLKSRDAATMDRFSMSVRIQIFTEILRAMHFAHARGYIHRDIKPANIMIGPKNEVVVMDWGLAKNILAPHTESLDEKFQFERFDGDLESEGAHTTSKARLFQTQHGAILGTPAYMSPEQAKGENDTLDIRSDIYSLCAVLYEFLSLHHYLGEPTSLQAMLMSVMTQVPKMTHTLPSQKGVNDVPPEMGHFLARGLSKDPKDRFQSIDEMIQELRMIQDGHCRVQCAATFAKRANHEVGHFINAHPMIVSGMVFSLPLLLVVGVVAAVLSQIL